MELKRSIVHKLEDDPEVRERQQKIYEAIKEG